MIIVRKQAHFRRLTCNAVGVDDGGQAVGDDDGGAPDHEAVQCGLHQRLALRVQRAGGLIQQQHLQTMISPTSSHESLVAAKLPLSNPHILFIC